LNINVHLNKNFITQYNKLQAKYGTEMARLNGFDDDQLSYTDFIDGFVDKESVADASIDGNANVGHKDILTMTTEMPKAHQKLLAFNKIFYELNKKYGFKTACEWLEQEWTRALYMHDAHSSTFVSYCFAYDLKDLAEQGLFFIDGFNGEPPQHLETFVDFVKEFISFACNRTSGAIGLPNIIPYFYYFWKKDIQSGYMGLTKEHGETFAKQQIQRFVYALNQPFLRGGQQSAFTNVSVFDKPYLEALFGGATYPDGTFMVDDLDEIQEFQKIFMETVSEIRAHNMMTFPVLTMALLRQNGKFIDEPFARWCSKHNRKWTDSNFFIDDSVTSLSNCCRLKSQIDDSYFNSIGGTALKVGSMKVSAINLARLAYESKDEQDYLVRLKNLVELDCKVLDVQRSIIMRNVEKGLMPQFSHGLVDPKFCYSTIGFTGVYETLKHFGYTEQDEFENTHYTEEGKEFAKKLFQVLHNTKDQFGLDKDYKFNVEQIPGESACAKMQLADQILYPEDCVNDLPLYGNQFLPLGIKATLQERIETAALFDGYCNGGSILHANLEAPFDSDDKAWEMLNYIADKGVTYFAFTTKIQACKNNHAFFGKKCPVCGGDVYTEYSRIVGFYVPVRTYSSERKAEWSMRKWENVNGN